MSVNESGCLKGSTSSGHQRAKIPANWSGSLKGKQRGVILASWKGKQKENESGILMELNLKVPF